MSDHELSVSVGGVAVVRCVLHGRPWHERAVRVLEVDAECATTARWPGAATRSMPLYLESLRTGDQELRARAQKERARGEWALVDARWQRTGVIEQVAAGRWFSVSRMFDAEGALLCWYVNFELPPAWRGNGWDTNDLALDLVVDPDGSWSWKDEDEYEHERRLGLITDAEHTAVQEARDEAVALIESRGGLFAENAEERWLPEPTWALPSL